MTGSKTTTHGADASATQPVDTGRPVWAAITHPVGTGFLLTIGGLLAYALGTTITQLSTILVYVAFAMFGALGLDPLVGWLERRRLTRTWSIVVVYTVFALAIVAIVMLIVPTLIQQITKLVSDAPHLIASFQHSAMYGWLVQHFGDPVHTLITDLQSFVTDPTHLATAGKGLLKAGTTIATTISGLVIVLVLSLYFLAALPRIKAGLPRFAPARHRPAVAKLTQQITDSIGGYLIGMVVLAFCNSVVSLALHLVLGLPFPLLMAVVAFCITLIPLVGSVLYWGLATVTALFTGWLPAVIFAVVYLIYMQFEAYVLTPRVMNRAVSVPGSLVVIGALVGGTLLGLLGALIAIPVTASILLIIKAVFLPRQDRKA